jgi:hypothetical protein
MRFAGVDQIGGYGRPGSNRRLKGRTQLRRARPRHRRSSVRRPAVPPTATTNNSPYLLPKVLAHTHARPTSEYVHIHVLNPHVHFAYSTLYRAGTT